MFRSSIFSFETLTLKGFRPRGLVLCILALGVIEFGLARTEWLWALEPRSESGIVDAMERHVIRTAERPRIIILGNSRLRDALAPRVLEEALGLSRGSVLNLSLTAGEPFDSMVLYRRNRDRFSSCRLLILGLDDWNLLGEPAATERVRRFATFKERWRWFHGDDRWSLLVGWIWRTYDARIPLRRFMKFAWLFRIAALPFGPDGRVIWRDEEPAVGPLVAPGLLARARSLYEGRHEGGEMARDAFHETISMARTDGLGILIIRPPLRDALVRERERLAPDLRVKFKAYLKKLVDSDHGISLLIYDGGEAAGLGPKDFLDYGHMTASGASRFSRQVALRMRQLQVLERMAEAR
ncbi:MAG: hypothetical protein ACE5ID_02205 [Acidobacteriota bacterium]